MTTTRALVLAAGVGLRMRAPDPAVPLDAAQRTAADAGIKALVPVGRPLLEHVLSTLADAGIRDVCLVVGPSTEAAIRAHVATLRPERLRIAFAVQAAPRGTADAVLAAQDWIGDAPFLVCNSDNHYPLDEVRALAALGDDGVVGWDFDALVAGGNIPAEKVRTFALLVADADGLLTEIVEKPAPADWDRLVGRASVGMNLWSFTPAIVAACRRTTPSVRGELELPDAVRIAVTTLGRRLRVLPGRGPVLDLSARRDIPEVTARLAAHPVRL